MTLNFCPTEAPDLKALQAHVGETLSATVLQDLHQAEGILLEWANQSPDNVAILVADPLEALRRCGAKLHPDTLPRLAAYRADLLRSVSMGDTSLIHRFAAQVPHLKPIEEKALPGPEA